jgi:hypothetical protein
MVFDRGARGDGFPIVAAAVAGLLAASVYGLVL